LNAIQALYQLSYSPEGSGSRGATRGRFCEAADTMPSAIPDQARAELKNPRLGSVGFLARQALDLVLEIVFLVLVLEEGNVSVLLL
jgi:hypothetical protein